jgi:hypothetical protein
VLQSGFVHALIRCLQLKPLLHSIQVNCIITNFLDASPVPLLEEFAPGLCHHAAGLLLPTPRLRIPVLRARKLFPMQPSQISVLLNTKLAATHARRDITLRNLAS